MRRQEQRYGFYVVAQQMAWRTGPQPGEGVTALAGYVHNSAANSVFEHFAFAGLLDKGLIPGRPDDRAGLSFIYGRVSTDLTAAQMIESEYGATLSNSAPGVQTNEMLMEANYAIAAYRGITVMPDLQWVIHPSAAHNVSERAGSGVSDQGEFLGPFHRRAGRPGTGAGRA